MGVSNGHACHIKKKHQVKQYFFNGQMHFRDGNNILLKEITEKLY